MELEGNLVVERRRSRRWVSALAVIVPVLACLAGVTWFIRAFISPPTISIPSPMTLAAVPPEPRSPQIPAEPPAAAPPASVQGPAEPSPAPAEPAASPAFAAAAVFPPPPSQEPTTTSGVAYADPAREQLAAAADEIAAAPI